MFKIGSYNPLTVARRSQIGLYLTSDGQDEVLLPNRYCPETATPGDSMLVFVYMDSEDRPIATTDKPKAVVGDVAKLLVKDVNRFGAFLDWGLEKDLFVPFSEQRRRLKEGEWVVVYVELDQATDRIIGTTWLRKHFSDETRHFNPGDPVRLIVYARTGRGVDVVVNSRYAGIIHANNEVQHLEYAEEIDGFVRKVREDGTLDIILRKPGYEGALEDSDVVLDKLRAADGFLPFTAKSGADEVREEFGISRKAFKKIIGNLYKNGVITADDDGIRLKTPSV
jgi:predicted RNA-binding protein (virulence factor B family)